MGHRLSRSGVARQAARATFDVAMAIMAGAVLFLLFEMIFGPPEAFARASLFLIVQFFLLVALLVSMVAFFLVDLARALKLSSLQNEHPAERNDSGPGRGKA